MSNCTNCSKPNPYQDGPFLCYECKNPPHATTKPVKQNPLAPAASGNPWTLGKVRRLFKPKPPARVNPVCKVCSKSLCSHRCGKNVTGVKGFFDDPQAWACPKGDEWEEWETQQWYVPDH